VHILAIVGKVWKEGTHNDNMFKRLQHHNRSDDCLGAKAQCMEGRAEENIQSGEIEGKGEIALHK
jgi:hypothetical protein